jgi:NitT/TauT family transport system permease protein
LDKKRLVLGALSVLLLVVCYAHLSRRQHAKNPDDTTIPTASQLRDGVTRAFEVNRRTEERWVVVDSLATGKRLFLGLGVGIAGSIVLGLLMGCFKFAEAFLVPPLSLLAKVPPTAALAVFFVMVGTDTEMYVAMIAFGVLPTLAQSVYLAVRDVPSENTYKAMTLGASRGEIILDVIFSQIRPRVIDAIRLQIGPAMVYLIAAEMVCGDVGFGYRIRLQSRLLDMSVVYPYLVLLASFGFLMDWLLRGLVKVWCPWYAKGER